MLGEGKEREIERERRRERERERERKEGREGKKMFAILRNLNIQMTHHLIHKRMVFNPHI